MSSSTLKNKNKNIHKERSKLLQPLVIGNTVSQVLYRIFYLIFKLVNFPVILTNTVILFGRLYSNFLSRCCSPVWQPVFHSLGRNCPPVWPPVLPPSIQMLTTPHIFQSSIQILAAFVAACISTLCPDAAHLQGHLYINPHSWLPTCVATYISTFYPDAVHYTCIEANILNLYRGTAHLCGRLYSTLYPGTAHRCGRL